MSLSDSSSAGSERSLVDMACMGGRDSELEADRRTGKAKSAKKVIFNDDIIQRIENRQSPPELIGALWYTQKEVRRFAEEFANDRPTKRWIAAQNRKNRWADVWRWSSPWAIRQKWR